MDTNMDTRGHDRTHLPLGAFCIIVGAIALWVAGEYDTGTFISMGPGFFPKGVSGALIFMGILIVLLRGRDLPEGEGANPPPSIPARLRIIGAVTASIIVFGAALKPLGLPVATFFMVSIAGFSQPDARPATVLATAATLAIFATILFAWALGLQIPVLPEVLR